MENVKLNHDCFCGRSKWTNTLSGLWGKNTAINPVCSRKFLVFTHKQQQREVKALFSSLSLLEL